MTLLTGGERTWAGGEKEEEKGSVHVERNGLSSELGERRRQRRRDRGEGTDPPVEEKKIAGGGGGGG